MSEQRSYEANDLLGGMQAVQCGAFHSAQRLAALRTQEPLVLTRVDTDVALASVTFRRAGPLGQHVVVGSIIVPRVVLGNIPRRVWLTPVCIPRILHCGYVQSDQYCISRLSLCPFSCAKFAPESLYLLYASLPIPLPYCSISNFRRVSHAARPEHRGENMTAMWTSHHQERCSDGVVAPHGFDPLVGPALGWCLIGATHGGQPWMRSLRPPHMHDGLRARRMAVLCLFRRSSMGRYVHCELTRNEWLDLTVVLQIGT